LQQLVVDCACGVGYALVESFHAHVQQVSGSLRRPLQPRNSPTDGPLNDGCGSEFVQKCLKAPTWYGDSATLPGAADAMYSASFDGDADRIVFFSSSSDGKFILMDGDKIAVLVCEFLQEQFEELYQLDHSLPRLNLGVVQTAYANGASTNYLQVCTHQFFCAVEE
jgi:phosphoacetylglucosamine mutase